MSNGRSNNLPKLRERKNRRVFANWLGDPFYDEEEETLRQDEFERLVWSFERADFGAEETDFLYYGKEQIIKERTER